MTEQRYAEICGILNRENTAVSTDYGELLFCACELRGYTDELRKTIERYRMMVAPLQESGILT